MFKKLTIALGLAIAACGVTEAQVQNYALSLEGGSSVDCGPMPQLNGVETYTFQFWFNPTEWSQGAVLFERGPEFKISLGQPGELVCKLGSGTLSAKSANELKVNTWAQVTLRQKDGSASVCFNNGSAVATINNASNPDTDKAFIIGGNGYKGRIDEVRIWNCYLDNEFENYTFTTLTNVIPEYKNLMVYYKMDQEQCQHLVDYCAIDKVLDYNNHGILKGGATKVAVNDNAKMPYIINAAYTANERFYDRVIPPAQYRMANDIICIGIQPDQDGHLHYLSSCDHATVKGGAKVLPSFEGRNTVLDLGNTGYLEAPVSALNNPGSYAFETYFYIPEWIDGAYLFRRENADATKGMAIFLDHRTSRGDEANGPAIPVIVIRVNGFSWWYPVEDKSSHELWVKPGQWNHVGVSFVSNTTSANKVFNVSLNGHDGGANFSFNFVKNDGTTARRSATFFADRLPDGVTTYDGKPQWTDDMPITVGQGLKGKIDQTVFITGSMTVPQFMSSMNRGPHMVTLDKPVQDAQLLIRQGAYYDYDDPSNPGFDLYSQDNWLKIMKTAFDGYRGARFYITVKNPEGANDGNMDSKYIGNASFRQNFATDLAALSVPYDGVELDLEWVYDWTNYAQMAKLIKEKLPAGKVFRVSAHNVTYKFPTNYMQYVDAFTFQQYGPQATHSMPSTFTSMCNAFVAWGYPREKIMTSYATTTSEGHDSQNNSKSPIKGVKDNFFDENYVPSHGTESKVINDLTFHFNGPLQTYDRAKFTREQGFMGIFYWDMGNDVWEVDPQNWQSVQRDENGEPIMHKYNLARYSTYAISPNIDRDIKTVDLNHYNLTGIDEPEAVTDTSLSVMVDGETLRLCVPGKELESVVLYNAAGASVFNGAVTDGAANISEVAAGIYILNAVANDGQTYTAKFIKK